MAIQLLSSDIVNQIAAGEVIENPSAVVKELVENSLDANSSIIEIELEQSGLKKIVIKDNGDGISKDDLLKAPLRHATSKISSFEDLYSISTMGFRGEALASIFSIAKTKIISLEKNCSQAYEITSDDISKVQIGACSKGTTIIVNDLFYNTPARKKYLKSETMELKKIIDIVRRFELIHYDKKIILKHNGTILVNKPVFKTQKENLEYVLGKDVRGKLVEVNYEFRGIKIKGFIGNPTQITYSYKKNQYFFVNSRYIKSKVLSDALYSGFLSKLMTNRHPLYFLEIEIDPEIIDVNVHPTKVEIRFEDEQTIYTTMESAILETFKTSLLFKEFNQDEKKEEDVKLESFSQELEAKGERVSGRVEEKKSYFTTENQSDLTTKNWQEEMRLREESRDYGKALISNDTSSDDSDQISLKNNHGPLYDELHEFKLLGQLDKTYIVVQTKKDMVLVDQHVAEEKYFYEMFLEQIKQKKAPKQTLLKGVVLEFDNSEMLMYKENKELLQEIGFESEEFGQNEVIIRSVPILFRHKTNDAQNLKELLYDIVLNKSIKCVDHEQHSKAASMACRMAVMAGDELTLPQMRTMIDNLRYLKEPFNCPHGRPTFLKYSFYDLQKKFKRVV